MQVTKGSYLIFATSGCNCEPNILKHSNKAKLSTDSTQVDDPRILVKGVCSEQWNVLVSSYKFQKAKCTVGSCGLFGRLSAAIHYIFITASRSPGAIIQREECRLLSNTISFYKEALCYSINPTQLNL